MKFRIELVNSVHIRLEGCIECGHRNRDRFDTIIPLSLLTITHGDLTGNPFPSLPSRKRRYQDALGKKSRRS